MKAEIKNIIDRKSAQVTHEVSKIFNLEYEQAFHKFFNSETYIKLSDEETKYWKESIPYILESFVSEKEGIPVNDGY